MQKGIGWLCLCMIGCVDASVPVPAANTIQVTSLQQAPSRVQARRFGWEFDGGVGHTLPTISFQTDVGRADDSTRVSFSPSVTCASIEGWGLEDLGAPVGLSSEDERVFYVFVPNTGHGPQTVACLNQGCSKPSKYDIHWSRACVDVSRCCVEPRHVTKNK